LCGRVRFTCRPTPDSGRCEGVRAGRQMSSAHGREFLDMVCGAVMADHPGKVTSTLLTTLGAPSRLLKRIQRYSREIRREIVATGGEEVNLIGQASSPRRSCHDDLTVRDNREAWVQVLLEEVGSPSDNGRTVFMTTLFTELKPDPRITMSVPPPAVPEVGLLLVTANGAGLADGDVDGAVGAEAGGGKGPQTGGRVCVEPMR
jgi:hypothetical protein